ncbi:MAG: molecular chaperone HtpG [Clostridia bacterium]|nr:molecular chaperone HtpG [Clostridia bacterium]
MSEVKKGGISVETQNIFPVIKRWLYSDKDIFLRELVSNACDAVTKMKRLVSLGEAENEEEYRITVTLDRELKTLTVADNGIGMTEAEIDRYINQIALSGALEFIEKYEGEDGGAGIIGHFGLGFYSAFMVAGTVEIDTLSFEKDAAAAHWSCTDAGEYEMTAGKKTSRGTAVILHITEEEAEYLEAGRLRAILDKYCAFMPVPIYFSQVGVNGEDKPVNDPEPLWLRNPSELTDEDYKAFYKKLFHDERDPLFYIHVNAEFPLNFKGILYFPKLRDEYAPLEGQVKLYYNQVFVADNIKEVIPEYMMLLRGVLDCPELPLNVSRSYLQESGYVTKIAQHVTKKICDKLTGLFNTDRPRLESIWDDLKPFVEYGVTRDPKFLERIRNILLYKTCDGEYLTSSEYFEKNEGRGEENTMYYASDPLRQVGYIELFRDQGITVTVMDGPMDPRFLSFMEMQEGAVHYVRIDSDMDKVLKSEERAEENEALQTLFEGVVPEGITVKQEVMKSGKTPAILTLSEEKRRLGEILKQYGEIPGIKIPENEETLVLNRNCPLIARITALAEKESSAEKAKTLARQVYLIAVIAQRSFSRDELREFIDSSIDLLYNA